MSVTTPPTTATTADGSQLTSVVSAKRWKAFSLTLPGSGNCNQQTQANQHCDEQRPFARAKAGSGTMCTAVGAGRTLQHTQGQRHAHSRGIGRVWAVKHLGDVIELVQLLVLEDLREGGTGGWPAGCGEAVEGRTMARGGNGQTPASGATMEKRAQRGPPHGVHHSKHPADPHAPLPCLSGSMKPYLEEGIASWGLKQKQLQGSTGQVRGKGHIPHTESRHKTRQLLQGLLPAPATAQFKRLQSCAG